MSAIRSLLRSFKVLEGSQIKSILFLPHRTKYYNNRHVIEKWKRHRARKVIPIDLPDFDKHHAEKNMTPDEIRSKMKDKGIAPGRYWPEREVFLPCTEGIVDRYRPPEEEAKYSFIDGSKKVAEIPKEKFKEMKHKSKIKTYEPGFNFNLFAEIEAPEIYLKAHNLLVAHDNENIFDYVTERCYPSMCEGLKHHTIHWKLLGNVEPPRWVRVRCCEILAKDNTFGQITVRFHTKQILAIYDRHGRLVHGSESDARDVLEYIVYEKHLVNEYGNWRIHQRIKPNSDSAQISKTYEIAPPIQAAV